MRHSAAVQALPESTNVHGTAIQLNLVLPNWLSMGAADAAYHTMDSGRIIDLSCFHGIVAPMTRAQPSCLLQLTVRQWDLIQTSEANISKLCKSEPRTIQSQAPWITEFTRMHGQYL
jgi:hypothetical protein